jgi:tripartite-type tricarboxylate transporter receptor subunit TctC
MFRVLRFLPLVLLSLSQNVAAADYPDRAVRIVVPIDAGSTTDVIARMLAGRISGPLGQPIVVENRGGAGGSIGSALVAKSAPDGYTLLIASSSHTVNPAIYPSLPYSTTRDFSGVTMLVTLPNILVVPPAKNITSTRALIDLAKSKPGQLHYGSGGVGSAAHMNAEQFRAMAKFEAVHVAYKGTPAVINDLIAGRLDYAFVPITNALTFIRAGRLLPLAVGSSERSPLLPDVPTTVEAGVPGSSYNVWIGLFAPGGTPRDIVNRLNKEVIAALKDPAIVERLAAVGAAPAPMAPEALDNYVKAEIDSVAKTVKLSGIPTN